jgi:hypothetical protein
MAARVLSITVWITAEDVMRVVQCARSTAYDYLHEAGAPRRGGLVRVSVEAWEAYAARKFGGEPSKAERPASSPRATRQRPEPAGPGLRLVVDNEAAPALRPTQPRTRARKA